MLKEIPGTQLKFVGQQIPRILPTFAEIVALPIVADWGPAGADAPGPSKLDGGLQLITDFPSYTDLFGDSDTPGRTAVAGALAGSGLPGAAGAGGVLVYRMAGASAAAATVTINETGAGPAGLKLTAKYKGARGDRLGYIVDTDPSNAARDRLRITLDGVVQETYLYSNTDVAGLLVAINARSSLVVAQNLEASAIRLAAGTGSLAGGDSGLALAGADHLATQNALEFAPYSLLSFFDLTPTGAAGDAANLASWVSWLQSQVAANRPAVMTIGGAPGETIDNAVARSATCNEPHIVNLGVGTYHDDLLGSDLSTSQLAPRIAGILAARGQTKSLTFAKIAGLHVVGNTGPTTDQVQTALNSGVTTLMNAESADADLRVAKGVTTYTGDTVSEPQDVFGDPRLVRVIDIYVRNMKAWGNDNVIGDLPVNDDTRSAVRGEARRLQDDLLRQGLILPGDSNAAPPVPAPYVDVPVSNDDTIPYGFGWQFAKTANAIKGTGTVL